ncbi:RNA polymerase sigma factor [Aeromicrobium sp. Leaf350]|uniref:RNA polymerase sigma factor n=1 Tax=Aeromicrobium sp. Leaf350 TaxID=2876565 RepID=UPI001E65D6F6|nr:DUF6596 domain-containing protein [Aeromicrobium sp. Leaf350]
MGAEHLSPSDAAEHVARTSYGRLLARLAASTGDVALAEDALAGALEEALRRWPARGVPDNPEGWILTVARNRQRDVWKSAAHRTGRPLEHAGDPRTDAAGPADLDLEAIGDKRLELLLVCAHPAIDPAVRSPLMLQTVLGLEAVDVARLFAVPTATMAQRLVRAKKRIRANRVPFVVPDRSVLAERLPAVLEAVYGCAAAGAREDDLAGEAQYLAVTLAALLEDEPEAWGLAALTTLALSRSRPRDAAYVPLDEQDPSTWDADLAAEGEAYLRRAASDGPPGRFVLEAAISAVHADRRRTAITDWLALRTLYEALLLVSPTLGARVAHAGVVGRLEDPAAGLALLDGIGESDFQPWHAVRAELLTRAGRTQDAAPALLRAAALSDNPRVTTYLLGRVSPSRG